MDEQTIKTIVEELKPLLTGQPAGKLFQLTPLSLAIDFRLRGAGYLFVSVEPTQPRLHLIDRRLRDLEKAAVPTSQFALWWKKELSNMTLQSIEQEPGDRVVNFAFGGHDEVGEPRTRTLVAQLTGRASNLFLLDEVDTIIGQLRRPHGHGPKIGDRYQAPATGQLHTTSVEDNKLLNLVRTGKFRSLSAAADDYYNSLATEKAFDARASTLRGQLRKELSRHETLLKRLAKDLAGHRDAEQQKRIGDLLLANLTTAERHGPIARIIDYFDELAPTIEVAVGEHLTLQEEAARRFAAYSRSKRAAEKINARIPAIELEISGLRARLARLEGIIAERDDVALAEVAGERKSQRPAATKRKSEERIAGVRRYVSSDGYEIFVGRTARDNDQLTFKVARPNDLWLHAADYPGSHVVVRNPTRKEMPQRTIIEAAQLTAYFSHARKDSRVAVRYTPRKFLSKPKGAAPGLVRLLRFKTIDVEPKESVKREDS